MTQTDVEDRLNEVVAKARATGLSADEILSALEIVTMALRDEEEG
ncbi:hypothetical protein [uncultured Rhodospira sp.]|nr:hypothetical protein [uncultured Rhodospira sp.]